MTPNSPDQDPQHTSDFDLFIEGMGTDLVPMGTKASWALWQRVYTSTSDLGMEESRGYRIIIAWRLTRAMMIEDKMLDQDERLDEMDLEDFPTPAVSEERDDFCLRVIALGKRHRMHNGSKTNPHLGYYGFKGITHPRDVIEYWPKRAELLFFEESLLEQLKVLILRQSKRKTRDQMRELLGLQVKEAGALISLAISEAQRHDNEDLETKRFIAEGWLTDYIDRARECGDLNSEMKGLKELAKVQGLTRVEPENQMDIMVQAIATVAQAAQRDEIGPGVGPHRIEVD